MVYVVEIIGPTGGRATKEYAAASVRGASGKRTATLNVTRSARSSMSCCARTGMSGSRAMSGRRRLLLCIMDELEHRAFIQRLEDIAEQMRLVVPARE